MLLKAGLKVLWREVATLSHLLELAADKGKRFLLIEVAVAIVVEIVPNVFNTVADDLVNRNLFDTGVLGVGAFLVEVYLHL